MFNYKKEDKDFIYDREQYIGINFFIKRIKIIFYDIFVKIALFFYNIEKKKEKRKKRFYVSICSIFKNEAKYFEEWLEYHVMIGVEHFYLYNNFSEDDYHKILEKYIKNGLVTLVEWPVPQGQVTAYMDCFQKNKSESQWICFLDLDEFICLYEKTDIKEWLKKYEKYPSIVVYWKMFGSTGKIKREKRLVIEEFYVSWEKITNIGKVFYNTNYELLKHNIHSVKSVIKIFGLTIKVRPINEFKKFIKGDMNRKTKNKKFTIQINHYVTKTYDEYIKNKMIKGDVFYKDYQKTSEYFYRHELKNVSCDYKIFRFLVKLKNKLEYND